MELGDFKALTAKIVEKHKDRDEEKYQLLDRFTQEVRYVESVFKENKIPAFVHDIFTDPSCTASLGACVLCWTGKHFELDYKCLLGLSAEARVAAIPFFKTMLIEAGDS